MPILFKCECGALWKADDDYANQEYVCPNCNNRMLIPAESDPECVLVFRAGLPNSGVVMLLTELQDQIVEHIFNGNDLIWYGDGWVPVRTVFDEMPEPLPSSEPTGEDIAVRFRQLPAVSGYKSLMHKGHEFPPKPLNSIMRRIARIATLPRRSKVGGICYYVLISLIAVGALYFFYERLKAF